ncbi:ABC transporter substrate-binding protein [Rhodococcus sp. OK302]|uniref:ABC transporter substrate-binding protein n=1 Tax=Rhodococcus sp. OK302 TaxID=1882769 RepID=UPI000B93F716|nr:ABC transporter substrate-binding protein [Rhodococcus sp. OK302]OYD61122.1 peptide/nickel transport system substrate-binding protein [Rhodococcus sp. OK302]
MKLNSKWISRNRTRNTLIIATSVIALTAGCTAAGSTTGSGSSEPVTGGILKVASGTDLVSLDPTIGTATATVTVGTAIYDHLMIIDKNGDAPRPNLATALEPNVDLTKWTMTLPTGVTFSDGTPFNASAVKFNIDRHIDPTRTSSAAALLSAVDSVDVPDESTVVFNLAYPQAGFPYMLANDESSTASFIASPTAITTYGKDYTSHASGVGPFKLAKWAPGQPVILERNPNYWKGADKVHLDGVEIRTIEDPQTAFQAVQAGDIDVIASTNGAVLKAAQTNSSVQLILGEGNDQTSIALNTATAPFDDIRVRQAVSKAVNRTEIVNLVKEGMTSDAVSLFPTDDPWYQGASSPQYDLDGAKALVKEYESDTGKKVEFTYICRASVDDTQVIERQLAAAGMNVKIEIQETAAALANFFGGKYQATCWNMAAFLTPDTLPYRFFHSTGDLNHMAFANVDFDAFVDEARRTGDLDKQKELWGKADEILAAQLPWVWKTGQPVGFIAGKDVRSITLDEPARLRGRIVDVREMWLDR